MTTDRSVESHRRMADLAYDLKRTYSQTFGLSRQKFLQLYELGEVQLSTVFENLFVAARNHLGRPTVKVSVDQYDFMTIDPLGRRRPLGDMKTSTVQKHSRNKNWSYRIANIKNKLGVIFIVGYDKNHDIFHYFAIPDWVKKPEILEIPVDIETGTPSKSSKYSVFQCASFEDMLSSNYIDIAKIGKVWK